MQDPKCIMCGSIIKVYGNPTDVKCQDCGSFYTLLKQTYDLFKADNKEIEFIYEFKEFRCVHTSYMQSCPNVCPTQGMYCKDHTSDKFIEELQRDISGNEKRLQDSKNKLDKVYESKKTWLIGKLSGIDEPRETKDTK